MALTGKTIGQLTKYTSTLTGNELFPLEYNGATYHVSQSQFSASYAPNIYNTDGTLTGNRTLSISSNKLIVTSTTPTTNYTFTLGTPTGVTAPSWPANQIKQGEFNISSPSTAEIETTTYWGRNQTTAPKDLWVNQIIANVTAESTGRTSLYNQVYTTTRGSVLDTSLSTAATLIGTWNIIGHTYTSAQATTASIVTSELRALYNDIRNYAGTITNAYGIKTNAVISNTTSAKNSAITNFYGYYLQTSTGTTSGPTGSITNFYGLYLDTPIVGTTGTITNRWGIYAPDTVMNHFIGGKVGIGTTSPAYKLDVNGAARVSGAMTIANGHLSIDGGSGYVIFLNGQSSNSYISFDVAIIRVAIRVGGFDRIYASVNYSSISGFNTYISSNSRKNIFDVTCDDFSGNNNLNDFTTAFSGQLGTNTFNQIALNSTGSPFSGTPNYRGVYINPLQTGFGFIRAIESAVGGAYFNTTSVAASAILQADSTTQGFLPPRMTNAQRTAISTPAVGLIVYCTDATEGLYVYKSTGWTFIA